MYPTPNSLNVPFVRQLEGPMVPSRVVAVSGTVHSHCNRFAVNLQCGGSSPHVADIALHVSVRFDQHCVVRNSQQGGGGNWQHEEREAGMPNGLQRGRPFQMLLLCTGQCFKIAFNGQHYCEFRHRLPFIRITHVSAEGEVSINSVSGLLGNSHHQTHKPKVPHIKNIGSIYPGHCLRVRGFVPRNAYRFSVNFASGPSMTYDDICLHVSTRPQEGLVELNTCRRGGWESGQQMRPCPLQLGQHFEMLILVDDFCYKIAFNGVHFAEWHHRHPFQRVNHVIVDGSVQLESVSLEGQPRMPGYPAPSQLPPAPYFPSPYASQGHHIYPSPYSNY